MSNNYDPKNRPIGRMRGRKQLPPSGRPEDTGIGKVLEKAKGPINNAVSKAKKRIGIGPGSR